MKEVQMIDVQRLEEFIKGAIEKGFGGHMVDEFRIKVELIEYSQMASHRDISTTFVLQEKILSD